MNKLRFWSILLWILCRGSFVLAAPAPLLVGTAADFPPLTYLKDGVVVGMEADFARLLGAQLGRPLQFKVMLANDLLPALEKGDVDVVMSGWQITSARQQHVEFADAYLKSGLMAVIRTDDVMRFHNPGALWRGGYRVAMTADSAASAFVAANLGSVTMIPVANAGAGLQALLDNRADVLIDDAATSWNIATDPRYGALMSLGRLLTEERLAWAVSKSRPELRDQLNQALLTFRQTGVLEHIYNRWIPIKMNSDE